MESHPKCPNCSKILPRFPGKKMICPSCNKSVYPRSLPSSKKIILVRESDLIKIDSAWTKYALKSKWFKEFKKLGTTEKDYMFVHDELAIRFGFYPRHRDIFWSLFNRLLVESFKKGDSNQTKLIQVEMEKFKAEEKRFGGKK